MEGWTPGAMAQRCRIDRAWYDEKGYRQQDIRSGVVGRCVGIIVMGQKGEMLALAVVRGPLAYTTQLESR